MMEIIKKNFWDDFLFQHFEKTTRFEKIDNDALFKDFQKNNMLDTLVEIIMSDPYFTSLDDPNYLNEKQVIEGIKKSFKKIYLLCNEKTRESVKKYIFKKLDFSEYFYSDQLWDIEDEYYDDRSSTIYYENYTYNKLKVDELLPKLDKNVLKKVLDYAFESQRGNKLLIITFFTRNKIEDKEFIQELQKNYGIYLEVDTFIKEMNQALKNIKTYKQFFEYIKSDFGNNMTEEDIIINCYKKAKEKKYINASYIKAFSNGTLPSGRGRGGYGHIRGRGGFRMERGRGGYGRGRGRGFI
jgi:hypothetical protein